MGDLTAHYLAELRKPCGSNIERWNANVAASSVKGNIYFVEATGSGRVKIGFATNIAPRMRSLATGCPFPLRLLLSFSGYLEEEREWHRYFRTQRVGNSEWFIIDGKLRNFIVGNGGETPT